MKEESASAQTTTIKYRIRLGNGIVLPAFDEDDALECQQLAEYEAGHVAWVEAATDAK
jgi:hypothetical protein